jgi:predicted ATPase/ABC-type cobalamin/Fe3+-siderophores transport system ATPase subunit
LHTCFATVLQGRRQIVFITGEAGIGKTTLVEAFLQQLGTEAGQWVGRGQCIEHYGPGEAYLPVLEALGRLRRTADGAPVVACLRQYAPTWLGQMPAFLPLEMRAAVQHQGQGMTRERMVRELAEAMEALAAARPVLLVLEDLHWSDPSTVEAIAMLARRRETARLLMLGTYRPVDLIIHDHPLKRVKQELAMHGHCTEVPLGGLHREAVAAYLAQHQAAPEARETIAAFVYRRTEGHPFFMVHVVDYLAQQDLLHAPVPATAGGTGGLLRDSGVPQGLRELIEAQVEQLERTEQAVLQIGSVAGAEFAVASVAVTTQASHDVVEAICERLAQCGQFLEDRGLAVWPDGTVSGRYGFRHALYQEVIYSRLGEGRRVRLHRLVGARLEQAYGGRAHEVAAELAMHFERGQETVRAVRYMQQAADNALQRYAYQETIDSLQRGLALLLTLPETPVRVQQELDLQLALGPALMATMGPAAPEVDQTYARARVLCTQVGETAQLFPTLRGLWRFYLNRGTLQTARELGEQLFGLAQRAVAPTSLPEAHAALGTTLFYLGEYVTALAHIEQGFTRTALTAQQALGLRHGEAPGVRCLALAAWILWCLGFPTQALRRGQEALAQACAHPYSLAMAQNWMIYVHYRRRDTPAVQAQAEALLTLATAQQFPLYVGHVTCWRGWALAIQGHGERGIVQLRQGMAGALATGQTLARPLCLVLLAEAMAYTGQVDEGLRVMAEALVAIEASGRYELLAEAYRLQGVLLLRQAVPDTHQAEACFQQALDIARRQQAKSWELRAALSLSRLWQEQCQWTEAFALLAPIYGWFTEGFDTADLQEARALLDALGRYNGP